MQIPNAADLTATPIVDFNPSTFTETSTNGATATASTGEVWTLNSTGAKPAQIVKSASLLFDGTDDFMLTASFAVSQPITTYAVWKQVTWSSTDTVYEGSTNTAGYNRLTQQATTPALKFDASGNAGGISAENTNLAVGFYGITTTIANGAGGLFQVNATTAITGNYGVQGITNGILLAADTGGLARQANVQFKEFLIFNAAHTAAEQAIVRNYLNAKHRIY